MEQNNQLGSNLSRRGFLGAAVATGMAGVLGTMGARHAAYADEAADALDAARDVTRGPSTNGTMETPPDPVSEDQIVETIEADIVVVGAGVAAMPCIMYAANKGANVHVVEKSAHEGVHRLCIAGVNPEYVKNFTEETIDEKQMTEDLYRCMGGVQSKMNILSAYVKNSGAWVDWVAEHIAEYGWALLPFPAFSGKPNVRNMGEYDLWPQYDTTFMFQDADGQSLGTGASPNWMKLFYQMACDYGANFHFNEPGYYLEREEGGRVTGVITRSGLDGTYRRYNASKGVLLAAGDFQNDKQMVHKYAPHLERCVSSIAEPNNTGDMHKAGMWVGAAMDDYSAGDLFAFQNVQNKNWLSPVPGDEDYLPTYDVVRGCMWAPAVAGNPVLWVDDGGRRFTNEGQSTFQQAGGQTLMTTPTGKAWSVWDSARESKFPSATPAGLLSMMSCTTPAQIEKEIEEGLIQRYDTLEELAEGCGFDVDYFMGTVKRYNYLCEKGVDEDCFKDPAWMTAIDTPPYYAAHWGCMITSTRCGLKTDECSRVIGTDSKVIPGLYAAGNNGGNFYGLNYPGTFGGTGIGHGQFFSYQAARDMLGETIIVTE